MDIIVGVRDARGIQLAHQEYRDAELRDGRYQIVAHDPRPGAIPPDDRILVDVQLIGLDTLATLAARVSALEHG